MSVSVITPTHLRDGLLRKTIESVLRQHFPDWEMLIVDDANSIETKKMVKGFNDSRIKYLNRPENKKGAPACRNIGLKNASGKYVMFLDSDDFMIPTCLENRIEKFKEYPDSDFLVFQTGFFIHQIGDTSVLWNRFDERDDLIRFLSADVVWHTSGSFFKRESLVTNELYYNEDMLTSQDWLFHIDVLLAGLKCEKVGFIPDIFVRRNSTETRISDSHRHTEMILNRIKLIQHLLNQSEIKCNSDYSEALMRSAFREFFTLLNTRRNFNLKLLRHFSLFLNQNKNLKCVFKHLKYSSSISRLSFLGYRVYDKLLISEKIKQYLRNMSNYRTPMTETEKCTFKNLIKEMATK